MGGKKKRKILWPRPVRREGRFPSPAFEKRGASPLPTEIENARKQGKKKRAALGIYC